MYKIDVKLILHVSDFTWLLIPILNRQNCVGMQNQHYMFPYMAANVDFTVKLTLDATDQLEFQQITSSLPGGNFLVWSRCCPCKCKSYLHFWLITARLEITVPQLLSWRCSQ